MTAAIRFQNVSKYFTLYPQRSRSFQEALLRLVPWRRMPQPATENFWALRDVSFEIEKGETVGLIGPNGVGKSTVLKLISAILEPTSGCIQVHGRVRALLELGAGFHPDLSGRENVYLNASMMGMRQKEIERRFDEIVAFSELESFIDVPVKHYSSGMYVRLGFAVAVHTDPEILLVDEVLAVGDAAFQRKCESKIAEFKREGRTILFVSHAMDLIQSLCQRIIWFEDGSVRAIGDTDSVIATYLREVSDAAAKKLQQTNQKSLNVSADKELRISEVLMLNSRDEPTWDFESGEPIRICIRYEATGRIEAPVFSVLIHRVDGLYISSTNTYNIDPLTVGPISGTGELDVTITSLALYAGDYLLSIGAYYEPDPPYWASPADFLDKAYTFRVHTDRGCHGVWVLPATWKHLPALNKENYANGFGR